MTLETMSDTSPTTSLTPESTPASMVGRFSRRRLIIGLIGTVIILAATADAEGLAIAILGASLLLTATMIPARGPARSEAAPPSPPIPPATAAAFQASGAGAWAWCLDDGSIRVDPTFERLTGIERGGLDDRFESLLTRLHPDDLGAIHAVLDACAEDPDREFDVRVRFRSPVGQWRPIRLVGGRMVDGKGEASLSGIAIEDPGDAIADDLAARTSDELVRALSDLSQANTDLERAQVDLERRNRELDLARRAALDATRTKSEFLANMSHEIRTPLTAIIGYAELIGEGGRNLEQCVEMAGTIRHNGEHLLSLVGDVLDLSKIEAGRMDIERVAMDPLAGVVEAVSLLEADAGRKGLELQVAATGRLPAMVSLDPTRFRQVVLNLVGNAVKFTPQGDIVVQISHHAASNRLEVAVTDTGIGLDEAAQARIFQPFRQADGSTTRRFGGTGLGLSISCTLCELLGGDLSVHSRVGRGSTFTAAFLAPPTVATSTRSDTSPVPKGLRVLLAEDGVDNRRLIEHLMTRLGASVESVENGAEAVSRVLEGGPFDLVLLDMQMPVMDGWEAARRIRNAGSRVPMVALTANALPGHRDACLEAGCDAYLPKPIRRDDLASAIAGVLDPDSGSPTLRCAG